MRARSGPSICLFTDSLEPSGLGEHMLALAAELRGRYRVSLACPAGLGGDPLLRRAAAVGLETLPLDSQADSAEGWPLAARLAAAGVDLVHVHAGIGWEGHVGARVARAAGVPIVVRTEHLPDLITEPRDRVVHEEGLELVDRVICVSEGVAASMRSAGVPAELLRVVRNGVRPRRATADRAGVRARLDLPADTRIILTIGRMTEQKGHRHLLEAAPRVVARRPEAHFVWAGQGPLEPKLRTRAGELGLDGRVRFAGRRDDVDELLAGADLFVLPSLFEGFPLAVLEAMAAELPVVGTTVCGTDEAVVDGETGRLVAPAEPAALASAILELFERPDLATAWGRAGRMRVEQHLNAERMADETAVIYEELLARTGVRPATLVGATRASSVGPTGNIRAGDTRVAPTEER